MHCKLFIDTMVFLHYLPLNELKLRDLLKADEVTLVVPRITLRELDKHKSSHSSRKIRERARKVLASLEDAISSAKTLPGALLVEYFPNDPTETLTQHGLNPSWNDDHLAASAILYRESIESDAERVVVLTQDTGPRLTCRHLGLRTAELDKALRLPDEPDQIEREHRELTREIQRIKNAMPRLSVAFVDNGDSGTATFELKPHGPVDEQMIQQKLSELRGKYPHMLHHRNLPPNYSRKEPIAAASFATLHAVPQEEYERYNKELEAFLTSYEHYLRDLHDTSEFVSRTIQFEIEIQNVGTAPADDVDVYLHFPDGLMLYTEDDLPEMPEPPKPPRKPLSRHEQLVQSIEFAQNRPLMMPEFRDFQPQSSFRIRETKSYEVTDHFPRIKHGIPEKLPVMYAKFPSYPQAQSFHCEYELRPANLTDPVTGQLHFVIRKESAA